MNLLFDLNNKMSTDVVLINRKTVVKNLLLFKDIMDKEKVHVECMKILKSWIEDKNFIFRVTAL